MNNPTILDAKHKQNDPLEEAHLEQAALAEARWGPPWTVLVVTHTEGKSFTYNNNMCFSLIAKKMMCFGFQKCRKCHFVYIPVPLDV